MNLEGINRVFMLGIGGIGMSAMARYFHTKGMKVAGYDQTKTKLTKELEKEGMSVIYQADISQIPWKPDLVAYTPAIPKQNEIFQHFYENETPMKKRAELLGDITSGKFTISVAGTHGKTTISALISYVLKEHGINCTAFVGGIMKNYDSNFIAGDDQIFVVEADEYDRSFLTLQPDIAIVSALDADHLDIYKSEDALRASFSAFVENIKPAGILICKAGLPLNPVLHEVTKLTYDARDPSADYFSTHVEMQEGKTTFLIHYEKHFSNRIQISLPGIYNVENSLAALLVGRRLGLKFTEMSKTMATFRGIRRRFDIIVNKPGLLVINDYAHHPKEIEALIKTTKGLYPNRKISILFQPHLFSRTRDLYVAFAKALSLADQVILLPIYPAREEAIQGISSKIIMNEIKIASKMLVEKSKILDTLIIGEIDILLIVGAGDVDDLVYRISQKLIEHKHKGE